MIIPTVSDIKHKLKSAEYNFVEQSILAFLYNADTGGDLPPLQKIQTDNQSELYQAEFAYINEWASIIIELFNDKQYCPPPQFLESLIYFKRVWEWLFSASDYDNTDQLISDLNLSFIEGKDSPELDENQIILLMALFCLNSEYRLPWCKLLQKSPRIVSSTYIGLIDQVIPAISRKSSNGFNYLLESAAGFPMLNYQSSQDIAKFLGSSFHSSYATTKDKYAFKHWLVKLIRFNCDQNWLTQKTKSEIMSISSSDCRGTKHRLKMLVMLEKLTCSHAMYRCYKTIFEALSRHFTLIAVAQENDLDQVTKQLFGNCITIENAFDIEQNAKLVLNHKPDIIFYPSIGMNIWTICLSQLRLAPKQIMMGGHPSSSLSNQIDNILIPSSIHSVESLQPYFTEKVIISNDDERKIFKHQIHPSLSEEFISNHNHFKLNSNKNEPIVIAINGVLTKTNTMLISLCNDIQAKSIREVKFLLFTDFSSTKLVHLSAYNQLKSQLKNFELVQYKDYLTYLKIISHADFLLPTLPFGGSNSNIDAMLLNKPKLYIRGSTELYTRTDQIEWCRMNLDSDLGCDSKEELVNKAVELVNNASYRHEVYEKIKTNCPVNKIFDDEIFDDEKVLEFFQQSLC